MNLFNWWVTAGCITCWLPCVTFGQIAEILDEGQSCKYNFSDTVSNYKNVWALTINYLIKKPKKKMKHLISSVANFCVVACCTQGFVYVILSLFACNCLLSCVYRGKLRKKYGLQGNSFCDCCVHCFCETCALCQEHAELRSRGLDPSRGCATILTLTYMVEIHNSQRYISLNYYHITLINSNQWFCVLMYYVYRLGWSTDNCSSGADDSLHVQKMMST